MSAAGWVVLGDGSEVEQRLERQSDGALPGWSRGAIRQRYPPGEAPIREERISEFPRMVNKLENPSPIEFSMREFVFALQSRSQNKSFGFNVSSAESASGPTCARAMAVL
jgi:hypothetical protein